MVYRIYVEKKPPYAVEARQLLEDIRTQLRLTCVTGLRVLNRYDVEGVDEALLSRVAPLVFFEPQLDLHYARLPEHSGRVFAWEALPGQFDQRADSCAECIQLISQGERPLVRTARVYLLEGDVSDEALKAVMAHVINPVESRPASLEPVETLADVQPEPPMVETIAGFRGMDEAALAACMRENRLAMEVADLRCCQAYFAREGRDPTRTELFMLDAYWSDHCRHTTFLTALDKVEIEHPGAKRAYERFLAARGEKQSPTLMELATFGGKSMHKAGKLPNLDVSEEINACTVRVTADVNGKDEPWLFLFKNETHNHPTEIEPFGGAATCIGGAIRDPLSGRAYVYHAMRITGAGDPTVPLDQTLPGKLPQRKLTQTAAAGFSAYGNQIGLATGLVQEIYHPGYVAKRMELGAVLGAAPLAHVRRECPDPGDVVLLIGGRTGRDGIGGASGSSKAHEKSSLTLCGAEVQKGNAPTERKLQRLFRSQEAARLIKRCNDFGAGGVSVAIGELADGLTIDLDAVPKKYEGLDGTELAISESQERMAVVVSPEGADHMIALANAENLEATRVAVVTEAPRLRMTWRGQTVLDLSRAFLNSNGAQRHAQATVPNARVRTAAPEGATLKEKLLAMAADLNVCGQKGLSERFDSTIGAGTVLMPFGGKRQLTPIQTMVAKLPVLGETTTCSGMAYGFNPYVMEQSPFDGAYLAVCESVAKLVAAGFSRKDAYLTLQEYFERLGSDPMRWGKPLAALLGALAAQEALGVASIGGKDSMSGSFERLDVPPTLVSFAVATGKVDRVVSTEFKAPGRKLVLVGADPVQAPEAFVQALDRIEALTAAGKVEASWVLGHGGLAEALLKMGLGNGIGSRVDCDPSLLFGWRYGYVLLCVAEAPDFGTPVGETIADEVLAVGAERVPLAELQEAYEAKLHAVFPYRGTASDAPIPTVSHTAERRVRPKAKVARPRAFIPVFPGTNCEYDTVVALERAGASAEVVVLNNLNPAAIARSVEAVAQAIGRSQMIVLPGGFSGGDEPDGSAKLIVSFFRNPRVAEAVETLLHRRDGLMLGICNGFQALIKLGLVPYGAMRDGTPDAPTLTYNTVGRHQSMLVRTRVASNQSPWLSRCAVGEVHTVAVSHGEGRFVIEPALFEQLASNGQIATQYVDLSGVPTWDLRFNPNASYAAVEGIASPDGRILGKMGHTERNGTGLYKNVAESAFQPLFEGGVDYFA